MQLSKDTLSILHNFAQLNKSIRIDAGSVVATRNLTGTVHSRAEVQEEFPQDFAIYDLSRFIGAVSLMGAPDITFKPTHAVLKSDNKTMKYNFAEPSLIKPGNTAIPDIDAALVWEWNKQDITTLLKAATSTEATTARLSVQDQKLIITLLDPKNPSSNTYSVEMDTLHSSVTHMNADLSLQNLMCIPSDYLVSVGYVRSKSGQRHIPVMFMSNNAGINLSYTMALEVGASWN